MLAYLSISKKTFPEFLYQVNHQCHDQKHVKKDGKNRYAPILQNKYINLQSPTSHEIISSATSWIVLLHVRFLPQLRPSKPDSTCSYIIFQVAFHYYIFFSVNISLELLFTSKHPFSPKTHFFMHNRIGSDLHWETNEKKDRYKRNEIIEHVAF